MKLKKHPKFNIGLLILLLFINFNAVKSQDNDCKSFDFNTAPNYQSGNAYSFTSADLDGDGNVDVITSNLNTRSVSVLRGDGAGGFFPTIDFPTEINVKALTTGDLNRDGKPDLIAADVFNNKITVLLNDGQGRLSAPIVSILPLAVTEFYYLEVADFNGDGKTDVAGVTRNNLNFFFGNGQGALTLGKTLVWSGNNSQIVVGNFNDDGLADLAVTSGDNGFPWEIGIIFGNQNGDLTFNDRITLTNRPSSLVTGDFNGDNITDIVVGANYPFLNSTPQTFYLQPFLGNGNGNFTGGTKVNFAFAIQTVAAGDFNGDGKLDLAAGFGSITATVNGVGDGTFQNLNYYAVSGNQLISADVNQDSRADLLVLQINFPYSNISVLKSVGEDGFLAVKAVPYGDSDITAADLNNDGLLDMITASDSSFASTSEIFVALNDGKGGFLTDRIFETPVGLRALGSGDFNGDGNKDVVTAHSNNARKIAVYLGDGTGNLGQPILRSFSSGVENVITGDFNNDGKDDIFAIDGTPRGFVLLSNGDGTFSPAPDFATDSLNNSVTPQTGDFNGDGNLDIVLTTNTSVIVWLGAGNGTFTRGGSQTFYASSIAVGDINADGKLDVVTISSSVNTTITRLLGDGNGAFESNFTQILDGQSAQIISADFNNDGTADIALISSGSRGNLTVIPSSVKSPFQENPIYYSVGGLIGTPAAGFTSAFTAADYDGDNKIDIGFTNKYRSRGVIYNNGGQNPCLSIDDVTITEGDSGSTNAVFTVSLSAASAETIRVNYTLEGQSATIGPDLQNLSGQLVIPAGQISATINIPINGDLIDEFDETFKVNLTNAVNAFLVKATGTGTISDDDAEPSLTVTDVAQNEPAFSQTFVFRVNLSAPSGKPISFRCATADGTATAGKDYMALNNTVNIQIGATFADCYVNVYSDNIYEPDETFFLNISDATNAAIADANGEGKIINNDPIPTLSIYGNSVFEGDSGTKDAAVNIQLTNPSYLPITFHVLTSSGTATAGRDYAASDTVVTVPAEQQTATANVRIIGDTINEPNETFFVNLYDAVNASLSLTQAQYLIIDDESVSNDYDGDGKTDFVVFRPNGGTWYTLFSSTNSFTGRQYGANTDLPVSGDYNGDGRTDIAVWRPSSGTWYTPVPNRSQQWGTEGDIPVQGDYDNDGKTDLAVFRPSNGFWYIQQSANNSFKYVQFGAKDDIPVQADYDGDGKTDIAVFRPSNNTWFVIRSSNNGFFAAEFGVATDNLVPADYDGDGKADIAVFRDEYWYYLKSSEGNRFSYFQWGQAGDKPVPGNYDGDDKTDFAVYRKGNWYIYQSSDGAFLSKQFGAEDDIPIAFVSNN